VGDWWSVTGREGYGLDCEHCGYRMYQGRCARSRCRENSERHLRRQAERVRANLRAFEGEVIMVTLTPPGQDVLAWDDQGRVGEWDAYGWNRYRVWEAWKATRRLACQGAHRNVKGQCNGLLAVVPELQRRGVIHLHLVLGAETLMERRWCEKFAREVRKHAPRQGFGRQVHVGKRWDGAEATGRYVSKVAGYVTKGGALRHLWESSELPGRAFYVSRRLTGATGCTMRLLRRRGALYASRGIGVPATLLATWGALERRMGREFTEAELVAFVRWRTRT
jgi:hypothetical protein